MPLILLLVLLVLFSPLAIDIYLPAIPQMAEQLGAEVTLMQGTITWFLFSMVASPSPWLACCSMV
jgi:DHA1 family bicyclomycin/chloramphenicol resistance-like MFS transporter